MEAYEGFAAVYDMFMEETDYDNFQNKCDDYSNENINKERQCTSHNE